VFLKPFVMRWIIDAENFHFFPTLDKVVMMSDYVPSLVKGTAAVILSLY
jgi:hypothetical protein